MNKENLSGKWIDQGDENIKVIKDAIRNEGCSQKFDKIIDNVNSMKDPEQALGYIDKIFRMFLKENLLQLRSEKNSNELRNNEVNNFFDDAYYIKAFNSRVPTSSSVDLGAGTIYHRSFLAGKDLAENQKSALPAIKDFLQTVVFKTKQAIKENNTKKNENMMNVEI